jgi:5-formyltetrahydrofolate cyclo-ligase
VGAAFSTQEIDALARQDWDVPLDALCSERETLLFEDGPQ